MSKFAGFLKRAKKVGNFLGKGLKWVNENIVKPLKPKIEQALEDHGYGNVNKYIDFGSDLVNKHITDNGDIKFQLPRKSDFVKHLTGMKIENSEEDSDDDLSNDLTYYNNPLPKKGSGFRFSKSLFDTD